MKNLTFLLFLLLPAIQSKAQVAATYGPAMVMEGSNLQISASTLPVGSSSAVAIAGSAFQGIITVDPSTGMVVVTDARPAGTYTVTLKFFNGVTSSSSTFQLAVTASFCSQAQFGGTTTVSAQNLPFGGVLGDFNNDNRQDIVVANYGQNTISVRLGNGTGGFTGTTNVSVGANPQAVVAGDFNADGKQDIIVANFGASTLSILNGTGLGTFVSGGTVAATSPYALATGDFNSDGRQDLAVANYSGNAVLVFLANGSGSFNSPITISVGNGPRSVATGDFNGDGKTDFATANYNNNTVSVRLGNGAGTFSATTITAGNNPQSIITGDFNGDGKQDLAIANISGGNVSIRLGNGSGAFTISPDVTVGLNPRAVIAGDFNGDGKQDIATANYSENNISVRTGNGTGLFSGSTTVACGTNPFALLTGDFNGDGRLDLATSNAGSNNISVRLNTINGINISGNSLVITDGDITPSTTDHSDFGNVTSTLTRTFTIQNTSTADLLVQTIQLTGSNASLFNSGGITLPVTIPGGGSTSFTVTFIPTTTGLKTATLHINNDNCIKGDYDFAIQGTGQSVMPVLGAYTATIIANAGGNTIVTPSTPPSNTHNITASAQPYFKGLLQVDTTTGAVSIINANPAGTYTVTVQANAVSTTTSAFTLTVGNTSCSQALFTSSADVGVGNAPRAVIVGDINGDGKQDLVTANNSGSISIRTGNGAGNFFSFGETVAAAGISALAITDLNGDGKEDIAGANSTANTVSLYTGMGSGSFSLQANYATGTMPTAIAAGDFNGDGKIDLVTANHGSNSVTILLGDGQGAINMIINVPVGTGPQSLGIHDFNGDGITDIVTANEAGNSFSVLLGNGTGGFTVTTIAAGINPYAVAAADFNADGKPDIALANYGSNTVSILLGNGDGTFILLPDLTVENGPRSLVAGDFNGDGKIDLAISNSTYNVSIRPGNGGGSFSGTGLIALSEMPGIIAIGDFNADGLEDLSIVGETGNKLYIRQGSKNDITIKGNGIVIADGSVIPSTPENTDFGNVNSSAARTFVINNTSQVNLTINGIAKTGIDSSSFTISGPVVPVSIAPGGSLGFTVTFVPNSAGIKNARLHVYNNNCDKGDYDFSIQGNGVVTSAMLGNYPDTSLIAGGNLVLNPSTTPTNVHNISVSSSSAFKGILQADTLTGAVRITNAYPAGTYAITVKAYGIAQAIKTFTLTVRNTSCSNAQFGTPLNSAVGNKPFAVALADFDNDGKQDIATANYDDNNISIRLGNGSGTFSGGGIVPVGANPFSLAAGDFNGDGRQDLAAANYNGASVSIRLGDGTGNFINNGELPVGAIPSTVVTGDFNADGRLDIAVSIISNSSIAVFTGNGAGNFNSAGSIHLENGAFSIVTGDFNMDGKLDIAAANYSTSMVSIHLGNGAGGFTAGELFDVGVSPYAIITADFNNDGYQDLATANYNENTVSVCTGNGAAHFTYANVISVQDGPTSLALGDFNGDAKQDLAIANYTAGTISIRLGNGAAGFTGTTNIAMGFAPGSLRTGDFNADGRQDIVVANNNSNAVSSLLDVYAEINVRGNNVDIADGAQSPSAADFTDFGVSNNVSHTFLIQNKGDLLLTVSNITITGTNASLFTKSGITLPVTLAPGTSTNFTITFMPLNAGVKTATINIINNDCDEGLYDFRVQGTFQCPATTVSFTALMPAYCMNAPVVALTGSQSAGSVFTGDGISDHGNGHADFNPALAGTGTHSITYTYTNSYGCIYTATQSTIVNTVPVVYFTGLDTGYCTADSAVLLTGNHVPNGVFSGPGITDHGDGTASFDPSAAGEGNHSILYSYTDPNGCNNAETQYTILKYCPTYITLNLKTFLEGFYIGGGTMRATLYDLMISTDPTETDTITVNLWSETNLANEFPDHSFRMVLHIDGNATLQLPVGLNEQSYYIAVKHRSTLETWSKMPVHFTINTFYNFSAGLGQAYGDGIIAPMKMVDNGFCAMYAGDINQDGGIDGQDMNFIDNEIGFYGYNISDINGDGGTDGQDMNYIDNNAQLGLYFARPY